ncbi:MAG TPA: ABC transporter ATP-binding protein [Capillimicrobium sp.]|jgi:spermidine/putrescine transport system ATP-binding protein
MTSTTPDITLANVTKRFGDTVAVDDVSLDIPSGAFFAMLGPSGCGKTTTLRMIGGFEDPTDGTITLAGQDVTHVPPYKRDVNTVFQSYALFPHLTIEKNVGFGLAQKKVAKDEIRQRVGEALELVELSSQAQRKPSQLSGGQQQRVALARALVNRPRALLLDEPLGALDLKLRKQLQLELSRIQREVGITFVHVTHDQEEAMSMADTIAVMNHGRIEQLGTPTDLYERPRTAFVANFLGACNLMDGEVAARAGDLVELVTPDGARLRVPAEHVNASGAAAGTRARVGVRPEKLRLAPAGTATEGNVLRGRVTDASFLGVMTHYVIRTEAGADLTVVAQNDGAVGLESIGPGREVDVSFRPDQCFVVDDAPAAAAAQPAPEPAEEERHAAT